VTQLKIAIRVDASSRSGTGHFMRCLTLARELKKRDAQVRFVSRNLPDYLQEMAAQEKCEVRLMTGASIGPASGDFPHAHWLETSQHADAVETAHLLSDAEWDWALVDHYALDANWETAIRCVAGPELLCRYGKSI
jgi:UDP-2,4-diacetamido-2,4,6-trideoxy-beta-L-altropyranose hydrolase